MTWINQLVIEMKRLKVSKIKEILSDIMHVVTSPVRLVFAFLIYLWSGVVWLTTDLPKALNDVTKGAAIIWLLCTVGSWYGFDVLGHRYVPFLSITASIAILGAVPLLMVAATQISSYNEQKKHEREIEKIRKYNMEKAVASFHPDNINL